MTDYEPIRANSEWVVIVRPRRLTELGGLVIPDHAAQPVYYGRVVSAGSECKLVKKGDLVAYRKEGCMTFDFEKISKNDLARGEEVVCVTDDMVVCTIEPAFAERVFGLRVNDIRSIVDEVEAAA